MNSAVVAPMNSTKLSASSEHSNSGDMRATMKMPAVTMVAAWISAEIGVGPSIESGSHTCSGTCADLPMAPMNRQMQMNGHRVHAVGARQIGKVCAGDLRRGLERVDVVERAPPMRGVVHDAGDAEHEAEVAHAVDQERLHVREDGRRPRVPEADQQIARPRPPLPSRRTAA